MRLLLDENAATNLESELRAYGHTVDHVESLELKGEVDRVLLAYAAAEGYDAIITKDRYAKREARLAALRAMRDGLCIIQLRFRQDVRGSGSADAQLRLILNHLDAIERAAASDSEIRQLILNEAIDGISRVVTADEVAAALLRLETESAD